MQKIGIFDSGIGGITVLSAIQNQFPNLNFVYLGDTANLPYGTKSKERIIDLTQTAVKRLENLGCDGILLACNTASAIAMDSIESKNPILGMIEVGTQTVLNQIHSNPKKNLVVFGTRATIHSNAYKTAFEKESFKNLNLIQIACPLLVPHIEEGWIEEESTKLVLKNYVNLIDSNSRDEGGYALLACTHYPWIKSLFENELGPKWVVLNSALEVPSLLEKKWNLKKEIQRNLKGSVQWIWTDQGLPPLFKKIQELIE